MLLLPSLLTATSCSVYYPTGASIPLMQHKGDLQVEASAWPFERDFSEPCASLSAAYAPTDHLAVAAYGDILYGQAQAMVGTYRPVDNHFVWETYGGLCAGSDGHSDAEGHSLRGNYKTPFVQFDCGWRNLTQHPHLDIGLSLKTGWVFSRMKNTTWETTPDNVVTVYSHGSNFLLEPGVEMSLGLEHLKFHVKASACKLFENNGYMVAHTPLTVAIGLTYRWSPHSKQ